MEWAAAGFVLEQTTDLAKPSGRTDVPGGDVDFHTRARPELLPAKKTRGYNGRKRSDHAAFTVADELDSFRIDLDVLR
ncbi:MAG: hypothetical protein DMG97_20370 [Acidobacteria bacterium]|nr:MAG: hypothetical protein DMG97_20370 [Acidobacteriota bacterium]